MRIRLLFFVSLLGLCTIASAMTPEQWRQDVDVFARELPRRHVNAFHHVSREQFDAAVAALVSRLKTANDDEMFVGLLQITAMVGDGHTFVFSPVWHRLPVNLGFFGGEVRVTRATEAVKSLLGGRLVKIDDTPVDEVIRRLRTILSQDETEEYVRGLLPTWIIDVEALHGLGILADPMRARLTVERDGAEQTLAVEAIAADAVPPLTVRSGEVPLSQQNPGESLAVTWLEPSKTVYVNFRTYKDLREKSRDLWKLVDGKPVEKIVIDLRQNGGGDYNVGRRYLVSELARRPKLKAFVLIGNRTFSAAMNNAIHFRDEAHAMLVGQPIGEKPNSYQERRSFTLPSSKLQVSYSTQFYKFVPDDAPNQVVPEKLIATTWDDFLAGRDPALDWVLAQK